jgi:hypothetical protein
MKRAMARMNGAKRFKAKVRKYATRGIGEEDMRRIIAQQI